MLRTASYRLLAASRPLARPLSTSRPTFIRVRHPSSPDQPTQPSPAEEPPAVPDSITPPPPFEPEVNRPAATQPFATAAEPSEPAATHATAQVPLEPPEPSAQPDLSKLPSLDIDPEAQASIAEPEQPSDGKAEGSRRTGAGRKEYVSSIERQRRLWLRLGLGGLAVGGLAAVYYADSKDPSAGSVEGEGLSGHYNRLKNNFNEMMDYFNKPAFKVLLPDPLPPPHQRPYTLIVDLEGLLVNSNWDRAQGWRTAKRPGVDYFLGYLSQFYEIVLFTSQPMYTAAGVAEKLDPFTNYLPYKLFRESTRYVNGKVVKASTTSTVASPFHASADQQDLSYLNRDLSKVIMLDVNPEHADLQPDNAIIMKPWKGERGDSGLVDMIPFLESIAMYNAQDVRPILKAYHGKDIPIEYAKKEEEAKQAALEEWQRKHPQSITGSGAGWLSNAFGSVASVSSGMFSYSTVEAEQQQSGQPRPNQPLTYLEQKRTEAQKIYQMEKKYYADNAEEFTRMIEEDKQKQLAEMKGSIWGFMTGNQAGSKPPDEKQAK